MIDLLVSSLMADRGLEEALVSSIAGEAPEPMAALKASLDSSVPLLLLVQQLIANATTLQMAVLKQVS